MTSSLVQFVLATFALVLGAAFEELLPKVLGVGSPVLMAAVAFLSLRLSRPAALSFAVLAGAMEDALSGLPPMTSASLFLVLAPLTRVVGRPGVLLAVAYPVYQVWLAVWVPGIGGGVFVRVLLACPAGFLTACAVDWALGWVSRKAAADERG